MASHILTERRLACTFPHGWGSSQFDEWAYYRNQFQSALGGNKSVEFLAFDPGSQILWLHQTFPLQSYSRN